MATETSAVLREVRVARADVQKYLDTGYVFKEDSESPDGRAHYGDSVVMCIPENEYQRRREAIRAPFERVKEKLNRGESPVSPSMEHAHAKFIFERESAHTKKKEQLSGR